MCYKQGHVHTAWRQHQALSALPLTSNPPVSPKRLRLPQQARSSFRHFRYCMLAPPTTIVHCPLPRTPLYNLACIVRPCHDLHCTSHHRAPERGALASAGRAPARVDRQLCAKVPAPAPGASYTLGYTLSARPNLAARSYSTAGSYPAAALTGCPGAGSTPGCGSAARCWG